MDYDIDNLVSNLDFESNKLNNVGSNLMLTNKEIAILDRYKINYLKCNSLKEIIFEIEDILNEMDIVDDDLDLISQSISERDYYQNTNK